MTRWGLALLVAYLVLGLIRTDQAKATRIGVWLTVVVIAGVGLKIGAL